MERGHKRGRPCARRPATGPNILEMSACNITHANPGQPSRPGSTRKNPVVPPRSSRPNFFHAMLYTLVATRRTHNYTCEHAKDCHRVRASDGLRVLSIPGVTQTLFYSLAHPLSPSLIARSSRMPWRRCSRPARATAPRTFTHGPVGRGSQASPPACMPCNVLSLAPSLPLSLALRLCGHADRDAAHFSQLGE